MTQLRRDAAYIRTDAPPPTALALTSFDEEVCEVLSSAHTVTSCAKTLSHLEPRPAARSMTDWETELECRVAESMLHLLQAERIELSPDS